ETARPDAAFPRRPNLRLHHRICPGGKVTERWSAARLRAVKQDAPIIGIDLGTTNSSAAYVDETGKVRLIPYQAGTFIMPSIFAIDDKGNELVGHEAKRQWQLNPRNTVYASKRLIGRRT